MTKTEALASLRARLDNTQAELKVTDPASAPRTYAECTGRYRELKRCIDLLQSIDSLS